MATKQCRKCKQIKDLSAFSVHQERKDGKSSYCMKCVAESVRVWRAKNQEKVMVQRSKHREYLQKWRSDNPEKNKEAMKRQRAKRRGTIKGRLNHSISPRICSTLRGLKASKHWESLVGYTCEALKKHLEKQFKSGMTWENYGSYWHVDHKIPVSAFNYEKPEDIDFKRCWALSNLQPLEATKNIKKSDNLTKPFQPSLTL